MRKAFLAGSTLVAAGLVVGGGAQAAEKINLQLSGFSKWWVVGAWQSSKFEEGSNGNAHSYNNVGVKGDNEVWFVGSTVLDNGMRVGGEVHLEAGGNVDQRTDTIDRSWIFAEGRLGKVILGSNKHIGYLIGLTAPDAAANWNEGGLLTGYGIIQKPATVNGLAGGATTLLNTTNNAEGITYVSPSFHGLTLGASYIPKSWEDQREQVDLNTIPAPFVGPFYSVGGYYDRAIGPVALKAYASGAWAQLTKSAWADSWIEQAYGVHVTYAGFTLGGSYRHQQANYTKPNINGDLATLGNLTTIGSGSLGNGSGFDAGIRYITGPTAVSFAYFRSAVQHSYWATPYTGNDVIEIYQVSGKYNLGPGVDVLSSAGYASFNSAIPATTSGGDNNRNSGWTVMSGLSLTF